MPALMLVLACALWGLSFPLIKALDLEQRARLPEAGGVFLAVWLQAARFGVAALLLLPLVFRLRITRRELVQGGWLAVWGGLGMALQAWGLSHTKASTSAFLTQAYCVFLPLIACMRLRCAPSLKTVVATVLVLAGGAILSGVRMGDLRMGRGEVATLVAAFVFTFQILTLENAKYSGNRGLAVTFVMSAGIAVLFFPAALLLTNDWTHVYRAGASWQSMGVVVALAVFCSVGAYGLMNSWQPRLPATDAGLIYTTEPLFTAAFALFLPAILAAWMGHDYRNETLNSALLVGGGLILTANLLMQWKRRPRHSPVT